MPIKGKKNLPIDEDTHKLIGFESVRTGRDMYLLIRDAWAAYKGSPIVAESGPPGSVLDGLGASERQAVQRVADVLRYCSDTRKKTVTGMLDVIWALEETKILERRSRAAKAKKTGTGD